MSDDGNMFKDGMNKLLGEYSPMKEKNENDNSKNGEFNVEHSNSSVLFDETKNSKNENSDLNKSTGSVPKIGSLMSDQMKMHAELKKNEEQIDKLNKVETDLNDKLDKWKTPNQVSVKHYKESLPNVDVILAEIKAENENNLQDINLRKKYKRTVSLPDMWGLSNRDIFDTSYNKTTNKSQSISNLNNNDDLSERKIRYRLKARPLFTNALITYNQVINRCTEVRQQLGQDDKSEVMTELNGECNISRHSACQLFTVPNKSVSSKFSRPARKSDSEISKNLSKNMKKRKSSTQSSVKPEGTYLYRMDALNHYKKYIGLEIAYRKEKLLLKKSVLERMIIQKQQLIDDVLLTTNAQLYDPNGVPRKPWYLRLGESARLAFFNENHNGKHLTLREQMYRMHEFMPIFTYFMCVLQLAVNIIMISQGGFAIIGLEPKIQVKTNIPTFMGLETIHHYTVPNIWMGPNTMFLIGYGAINGPCIRDDIFVSMMYAKQGYGEKPQLGCCEMPNRHAASTTTQTECEDYSNNMGIWIKGVTCSERQVLNASWVFNHVMRPCCFSMKMRCRMLSHEHCAFLEGRFFLENMKEPSGRSDSTPGGGVAGRGHSSANQVLTENQADIQGDKLGRGAPSAMMNDVEHCSQVNCVSTICGLQGRKVNPDIPYLTKGTGQWFRLIVAIFQHHGVIHVMAVVILQLLMGHQIEIIAGWLRLSIIYFTSGFMGLLMGAAMNPFVPHIGGTPAVMGIVGCSVVELVQTWSLVANPCKEALKLFVILAVFSLAGTLPFIDNVELITGFVFGVMLSVVLLPYVTYSRSHAVRKRIVVAITLPLIFVAGLYRECAPTTPHTTLHSTHHSHHTPHSTALITHHTPHSTALITHHTPHSTALITHYTLHSTSLIPVITHCTHLSNHTPHTAVHCTHLQ